MTAVLRQGAETARSRCCARANNAVKFACLGVCSFLCHTKPAQVWTAMNTAVAAIRHQEAALGQAPHIITVQGTRGWARDLSYYVTHPVTAGQGANVVYETHVYNPAADLGGLFVKPSATLPILIGEFGPAAGYMSLADSEALMQKARNLSLPWTGWSLHMRCDPSMLQDLSGGGCGIGMALKLTPWGTLVQKYLQMP
ncbi:hypothetical protein ABPG75_000138 [Micractinium tetrahymenae]